MNEVDALDLAAPLILSLLEPKAYLRAAVCCKRWHAVSKELQVRKAAFIHYWGLLAVHGVPRQLNFFETAGLSSFVQLHHVQRTDSLQMLAVRHQLDVSTLRRVNNLMTDHSLHSRTHVYVPVAGRQQLRGRSVGFSFCPLAKREFAVIIGPQQLPQQPRQRNGGATSEELLPHSQGGAGEPSSTFKIDALQAKLCQLVGRSLHVDDATAKFYLEDAGGDVKAAMQAFAQDLAWEGSTPGPIRKAPVQRWIQGEVGI